MPGAVNDMAFEVALGERAAAMRAGVGDRVAAAFDPEQGNRRVAGFDRQACVVAQLAFRRHPEVAVPLIAHALLRAGPSVVLDRAERCYKVTRKRRF